MFGEAHGRVSALDPVGCPPFSRSSRNLAPNGAVPRLTNGLPECAAQRSPRRFLRSKPWPPSSRSRGGKAALDRVVPQKVAATALRRARWVWNGTGTGTKEPAERERGELGLPHAMARETRRGRASDGGPICRLLASNLGRVPRRHGDAGHARHAVGTGAIEAESRSAAETTAAPRERPRRRAVAATFGRVASASPAGQATPLHDGRVARRAGASLRAALHDGRERLYAPR